MKIIGINEGHNSSVCLMIDGEVIFAISEERLSRTKNEVGFPERGIRYILDRWNLSPKDIDAVAVASNELSATDTFSKRGSTFGIQDYIRENHEYWKPTLIEGKKINYYTDFLKKYPEYDKSKELPYDLSFLETAEPAEWNGLFRKERIKNIKRSTGVPEEKIHFIDHHTGHAAYAYYCSPLRDDVLVITADGWGDGANAAWGLGNKGSLRLIKKTKNNNLARLYRWTTLLLGMKPNEHEYKVMGLAPYSKEYIMKKPYEVFSSTLIVDGDDFAWNTKPDDMYFWFKEKLEGCRFDGIAAGLQRFVEDRMVEWVRNLLKKHPSRNIVFSGGLALNVKLNKRLMELDEIEAIHIPPSGGDESLAVGAALQQCAEMGKDIIKPLSHVYLGPSFTREDILKAIEKRGVRKKFKVMENVTNATVARYLSQGKIIARCTGRMEFGARALGNRSILSNPNDTETIRIVNEMIKFRDFWMPFTPSILEEDAEKYLINPKKITSPYMTLGYDTTELGKDHIKAAIHPYDKTARPQFVIRKTNPEYHDLITEFKKITGISGLLNTSLNLHGEPIACTPEDAIHILEDSELDMLYMEDILIMRE